MGCLPIILNDELSEGMIHWFDNIVFWLAITSIDSNILWTVFS